MTKKDLIKALRNYPDSAPIFVRWWCEDCDMSVIEKCISVSNNGTGIQFNSRSFEKWKKKFNIKG